jgi:hypothetical protein
MRDLGGAFFPRLRCADLVHEPSSYSFPKMNWNGVAQLPHRLGPASREGILVGETHETSGLSQCEVSQGAIIPDEHVFAARHPVIAGLQCLRGEVQRTAGMSHVGPCTTLKDVAIQIVRLPQSPNRISHGNPREAGRRNVGSGQAADEALIRLN